MNAETVATLLSMYSGDRTVKGFSTAKRYVNDGTDDDNYTVDFGNERYVEFRVRVKAASMKTAIAKAVELINAEQPYSRQTHELISVERDEAIRTWWESEYENAVVFDRGIARRQEPHLNRFIEEMRSNPNATWSIQLVN